MLNQADCTMTTKPIRTDEELTEIAKKIHAGAIFTSASIPADHHHMLGMVFMPLMFADEALQESFKEDPPHLVYAEMSKALPRGVNGYPMFPECAFLNEREWMFVRGKLEEIQQAMQAI